MTQYQTVEEATPQNRTGAIKLHGPEGFEGMRKAGRLAAEIIDSLVPHVVPGVTTGALDDMVREQAFAAGAVRATLGYRGFTHSCCTSINHVVCHGIPGEKKLNEGDIISLKPQIIHNLTAVEESVVRLTLSKLDTLKRVESV